MIGFFTGLVIGIALGVFLMGLFILLKYDDMPDLPDVEQPK